MSTENDFRPTWDAERIADLRKKIHDRTDVYLGTFVIYSAVLVSLLDELERARQERDAWRASYEEASDLGAEAARERDEWKLKAEIRQDALNAELGDGHQR